MHNVIKQEARPRARFAFTQHNARIPRAAGTLVFALSTLLALHICFLPATNTFDYPMEIISVQRILHGQLPDRDFQALYGVLGHFAAAAFDWPIRFLQPLFAFNCYVFFSVLLLYAGLSICLARTQSNRRVFLVACIVLILLSGIAIDSMAWYILPMILPMLGAICTLRWACNPAFPERAIAWQCTSGVLLAIEALTRINFGVYLAVAVIVLGLAAHLTGNRLVARAALVCIGSAFLTGVVILCILQAFGILEPALADIREFIIGDAGRRIPLRYASKGLFALTMLSFASTLAGAWDRVRRRQFDFSLLPHLLICASVSYALFNFESFHLFPFLVLSLIVLFDVPDDPSYSGSAWRFPGFRVGLAGLQMLFLLILLVRIAFVVAEYEPTIASLKARLRTTIHLPPPPAIFGNPLLDQKIVRRGFVLSTKESAMLDRLDRLRKPGEEIFWASVPGTCESAVDLCLNVALYLADDTLPRQRRWIVDVPFTPYESTQRKLVASLEAAKTPWIGMQGVYVHDPRAPIAHPEARILFDYVKSHYTFEFDTDIPDLNRRYSLYARKN